MNNKKGKFVTVKEAARALGVAPSTVYKWIDEGTLKAKRLGPRMLRISAAVLKKFQE